MNQPSVQLLMSLGRVLVGKGLKALEPFAPMVPYGGMILDVAKETWDDYIRCSAQGPLAGAAVGAAPGPSRVEIDLRVELESLVRASPASVRQQVDQVTEQVAGDQSPELKQALANYLAQVPAMLRRSMRRPSDPTGTTVPSNLVLRKGEDLVALLPPRPSRFKSGDRPLPGVDWVLDDLLGVGGFGEVWKAHHAQLKGLPPVALKFCIDEQAAKSLRNEAGVLSQVMEQTAQGRHEGIVQLRQAYLQTEAPCLEYEYIAGGDLAGLIQELHAKGRPAPESAAKIVRRLAAIIGSVHQQRPPIVHRDLKPANILVQKSAANKIQFKVADFGIGQVTARESILTSTRGGDNRAGLLTAMVQGSYTPLYASPQQVRGDPADTRDDVYSLGVIWHQLLTGDLGSGAPSGMRWTRDLTQRGMAQSQIDLLASCFESNPADRPAHAGVLAEKLARLLESAPESPPKPEPAPAAKNSAESIPSPPGPVAERPLPQAVPLPPPLPPVAARKPIPPIPPPVRAGAEPTQDALGTVAKKHVRQPGAGLVHAYSFLMPFGVIALFVGVLMVSFSSYSYWDPNMTTGSYFDGKDLKQSKGGIRHSTDVTQEMFGVFFCFVGGAAVLAAAIVFLIWLHRAWRVVPPEYDGLSPGLAVGLLCIPIFNLYWMFRVIPGLSTALGRVLQDRNPERTPATGFVLGLAACITGLIPMVNAVSLVLFPLWMWKANRAKNLLIEAAPRVRDAARNIKAKSPHPPKDAVRD